MLYKRLFTIFFLFILLSLLYWSCNGDCSDTKVIFKIVGYQTDMCPEPIIDCIDGDYNTEFHNGDGMGSGWYNNNYYHIPFSIEETGSGWTSGGSFEITQEGDCIDLNGTHGYHYKCS
ncbi:MAG: hypothetical protein V1779_09605 [bacterium]